MSEYLITEYFITYKMMMTEIFKVFHRFANAMMLNILQIDEHIITNSINFA